MSCFNFFFVFNFSTKNNVSTSVQGAEWEYRAEIFAEADPRFEVNRI